VVAHRTFGCNPTAHEWQSELGSRPSEAEIAWELETGYAYAGSMSVHSSDGNLSAAEDSKCHLSTTIPVR
jgi:hypothetical protein